MATFRKFTQLFQLKNNQKPGLRFFTSGKPLNTVYRAARPVLLASLAAGSAYLISKQLKDREGYQGFLPTVLAKVPAYQSTVISDNKDHAAYVWIHLSSQADAHACAKVVADINKHVLTVLGDNKDDEYEEMWAGVGFGPEFYKKVGGKAKEDYSYLHRSGKHGDMPTTGGDIFIHAKCSHISNLYDLTNTVLKSLPKGSVEKYEDIYSFVYRYGRDLSGFVDGTENPADDEHREEVAVEKSTGGSYVITQKWVHDIDIINNTADNKMSDFVGRAREDSVELKKKPISSHVARMTGGNAFEQTKKHEIVRQSMPYGSFSKEAGLFFIAYAASPVNFNYMLDQMVGKGDDAHHDDIMRLTKCTEGAYWYFPSESELKKL